LPDGCHLPREPLLFLRQPFQVPAQGLDGIRLLLEDLGNSRQAKAKLPQQEDP
jgi:hypothetical protein